MIGYSRKVGDTNYEEDYNKMKELGIESCGVCCWLGSRHVYESGGNVNFCVRVMKESGDLHYCTAISDVLSDGRAPGDTNAVRPVVKINSSALNSN